MKVGHGTRLISVAMVFLALSNCGAPHSDEGTTGRGSSPAGPSGPDHGRFLAGKRVFQAKWGIEASGDHPFGGIGPVYNRPSCASCHPRTGRGNPPLSPEHPMLSMVVFLGRAVPGEAGPDKRYGRELSPRSIPDVPREGWASIRYEERAGAFADGTPYRLRAPRLELRELEFGGLDRKTASSARVAPSLAGLGLLERVPAAAIVARADPRDSDGDGISGRPNRVVDLKSGALVIGRFGWKAAEPSLRQQNAAAFLGDMGITTDLIPDQNCPDGQAKCRSAAASDPAPEATLQQLDDLTSFIAALPPPEPGTETGPQGPRGELLFEKAGCAACHVPAMPLADGTAVEAYTDLLLHDMGPGLADGLPQGQASGDEWRTPPLWGLGRVSPAEGGPYLLHDGRARGLLEAILWHGGEARASREAFRAMKQADREALIIFLGSL